MSKKEMLKDIRVYLNPDDPNDIILKSKSGNPAFDPNGPEFDEELYNKTKQLAFKNLEHLRGQMQEAYKTVLEPLSGTMEKLRETMTAFFSSDPYKNIIAAVQYIIDNNEELKANLAEWEQLQPYLEEEIKKPIYEGKSIDDLLADGYEDDEGNIIEGNLFDKAVAAARAAMIEDKAPTVDIKSFIDYTQAIDKPNNKIWSLLETDSKKQLPGQIGVTTLNIGVENEADKAAGIERNISYSISFSDLNEADPVMKRLTPFDKRVYFAIANLYKNGNEWISSTMIYHYMGNTGAPNSTQRKKILDSVKKMMGAIIEMSNIGELFPELHPEAKPYNYPQFEYTGTLLHAEFIPAVINGKYVDDAIHILRLPIMFEFALRRKQITTFNRKVLELPLDQRDSTLQLEDYLIENIQQMKSGRRNKKMLYATIYKELNVTAPMQQSRTKDKILTCLDYWKTEDSEHFIRAYKQEADGITIILEPTKKQEATGKRKPAAKRSKAKQNKK